MGREQANRRSKRLRQPSGLGVVPRALQYVVIPILAVGIAAWGFFGTGDPSDRISGLVGAPSGRSRTIPSAQIGTPPPAAQSASSPTSARRIGAAIARPTMTATAAPSATATRPARTPASDPTAAVTAASSATARPAGQASDAADVECSVEREPPPALELDPLVTTAPVNLRSGPTTECGVLEVLVRGTVVEPLGVAVRAEGRRWLMVEVGNRVGWAAADFLEPEQ